MNYRKVFFIWLLLIGCSNLVISQYCNDTICVVDDSYIPNVTKHLWLIKKRTEKHFSEDSSLKTLVVFNQDFRLKRDYKFLNSLKCLNCIMASKKIYKLDSNYFKLPNLKQVNLNIDGSEYFPLFILTANDIKSISLSLKNEQELHYLKKYSLDYLSVYFEDYQTKSLPPFIYSQSELTSLNFIINNKIIHLSDSIQNLIKLENLALPIELNETNIEILSKLNLKYLKVNSIKLNTLTDIQKKLPQLSVLDINKPMTIEDRKALKEANPKLKITTHILKN